MRRYVLCECSSDKLYPLLHLHSRALQARVARHICTFNYSIFSSRIVKFDQQLRQPRKDEHVPLMHDMTYLMFISSKV